MINAVDSGAPVQLQLTHDGRAEARVRTPSGAWVRLHSLFDPAAEARAIVDRALDGAAVPPVVIIIGVGLAPIVEETTRRGPDARVIALELFERVPDDLRGHSRPAAADGGVTLVASGPAFQLPVTTWPSAVLAAEPLVIVQPIAAYHWPQAVERARLAAQQYIFERRANEEARERLAPLYLAHTLQNLPELLHGRDVSTLDGIAAGDPLVLCGAGPSLDRQLQELRDCRNRAWLVAIDTAVRPLMAAGIVPDLVVSIDPTAVNGRHLIDLPSRDRPWLVAESSLDPRAVRAFAGRLFFCRLGAADPWPWFESMGVSATKVRAWGSVLTTACDVVRRMRPARVAFAGIDLAYTGGRPYCRGTAFEADWEAQRERDGLASIEDVWRRRIAEHDVAEPDIHGTPAATARHLIAFRNWVRTFVAEDGSCEYANTTGDGILHGDRIVQCRLDEWLVSPFASSAARERLTAAARRQQTVDSAQVASAVTTAAGAEEPWRSWTDRVPRIDRSQIERHLRQAAREIRAREREVTVSAASEWVDVPFDSSHFFAQDPMVWQVAESNVGTFAYKVDGKTMMLSFKINSSTLAGAPSWELFIRLPGNYLVARGAANAVWLGSRPVKEMGYITVHPGHDFAVIHRSNEERFPLEQDDFFVFGQLLLEVQ